MNLFECKVRYEKTLENGLTKKVKESYIVDALSCSEAEARITQEMRPFMIGEYFVPDIKEVNYSEIFFNEDEAADKWYKAKMVFITLDEKSGAEKKTASLVLVQSPDLRGAVKYFDEQMNGTIMDYEIVSVSETAIVDVYMYEADGQNK